METQNKIPKNLELALDALGVLSNKKEQAPERPTRREFIPPHSDEHGEPDF